MSNARKIRQAAAASPATLVAFDLLYAEYESMMNEQLQDRRERLSTIIAPFSGDRLAFSETISREGTRLFREVVGWGLEGIIAKRRTGKYLPGRRSDGWIKSKRRARMACIVVGFVPEGRRDFHSLLLAADSGAGLEIVGSVETGITHKLRDELNCVLWTSIRDKPVIPCRQRALWVEPTLYCWVSYMERTRNGQLRNPVFQELVS
jgi:ATP-dependent DNA ligase